MFKLGNDYRLRDAELYISIGIAMHNAGLGIAEDSFFNLRIVDLGGSNNLLSIEPNPDESWISTNYVRMMWNFIHRREYRLSPDATSEPAIVHLKFAPPFQGQFRVKLSAGANGAVPYRGEWQVDAGELVRLYDAMTDGDEEAVSAAGRAFAGRITRI